MKNRFIIPIIWLSLLFSVSLFTFAESGSDTDKVTNFEKRFYRDYTTLTSIANSNFNAAEFTIDMVIQSAEWLGIDTERSGSIKIKTDADKIDIFRVLPNLNKYAVAEELSRTKMAGYTFSCSNLPLTTWNGENGQWETSFQDPSGKIKKAMDTFSRNYISATSMGLRSDKDHEDWFDSYIIIPAETYIQYGTKAIKFNKEVEIDELYDEINQKDQYASLFAENIYKIQQATELIDNAPESNIEIIIPSGTVFQLCGSRFRVKKPCTISVAAIDLGDADPIQNIFDAISTAEKTDESYVDDSDKHASENLHGDAEVPPTDDRHPAREYFIHTCDATRVFESGFGLLNELIGVLAESDTEIIIGDGTEEVYDEIDTPIHEQCAEIKVQSSVIAEQLCKHTNTKVEGKISPTITVVGYTGDVVCADCGKLITEGDIIAKLPSSIKLNATSLRLKVGQSSSALKVSYKSGDSIKSVKSSKTAIVQATKAGANTIKLKAGRKTGTAKVTVILASGKTAVTTVKVQKKAVTCTGIKLVSGSSVTLKKGKTRQIKVTRKPITCVQNISYKSSNKKVATVTSKGKIKAKKKGSAKITINCGRKKKIVKVKVK